MTARRAVTLVDVARAAGVSRTTASVALAGHGRVSEDTRRRVAEAALALGYVANPMARHLRGQRRGAIGLYLPEGAPTHMFYMNYMIGAAGVARQSDAVVTLFLPDEEAVVRRMSAQVDGFLIADPTLGDPTVATIFETGLPIVSSEASLDPALRPRVTVETDYRAAFSELLDHLEERGAKAPALMNVSGEFSWRHIVDEVYEQWCAERDIAPVVRRIEYTGRPESVRAAARRLLEEASPDAIVGATDGTPVGVVGAVRDLGLRPGHDVLVAGAVDSIMLRYSAPSITAIDTRAAEIGRDAAAALLAVLDGEDVPERIMRGRFGLNVRESTSPVEAPAAGAGAPAAPDGRSRGRGRT